MKILKMYITCKISKVVACRTKEYQVVVLIFLCNAGIWSMGWYRRILEGDNFIKFPLKFMFNNHMMLLDCLKVVISMHVDKPYVRNPRISIMGKGMNLIKIVNACKINADFFILGNVKLAFIIRNFSNFHS